MSKPRRVRTIALTELGHRIAEKLISGEVPMAGPKYSGRWHNHEGRTVATEPTSEVTVQ